MLEFFLRARSAGAEKATLEVSTMNSKACSFYNQIGFETHGIRMNYYRNGSDALIQWKCLKTIHT